MASKLPDTQNSTPVLLGGQAALFDDPRLILQWDDAFLRSVAANIGKEGGSILAQIRRAAGLVAWAAWHRFDDKACESFLRGIAENLGVNVRTVREWRKAVIDKESLPIPALAAARSEEAFKRNRTAGQKGRITTPSTNPVPIPASSTVEPVKLSDDGERGDSGATRTAPALTPPSDPSSGGAGLQPSPRPTGEADSSPRPAPPDPPDRLPTYRALTARVVSAMHDVDPELAGPVLTPEDATVVKGWADRAVRAWQRSLGIESVDQPSRSPGHVIRPKDRKVPATPTTGAPCTHPKPKQRHAGYAIICDDCGKVLR